MADMPYRNRSARQLAWIAAAIAIIGGAALVVVGVVMLTTSTDRTGAVAVIGLGIFLVVLALMLQASFSVLMKVEANLQRLYDTSLDLETMMKRVQADTKAVAQNSNMSDAVRSITHRENEREALRQAIREEMFSGDWEAAHYLISEMERRFGYKQEATALREELANIRNMTIEEKITEAITHIEQMFQEHRWERARVEIERLLKLFPRHERVTRLPAELTRRRDTRKQELLRAWEAAVQRDEVHQGIAILTELDQYLTREEAQTLKDSARHVFKSLLLHLGVQFSLAVQEGRWRDALEVGLQITHEFPNSRMAQEVNERIETLRARAGFAADPDAIVQRRAAAAPVSPITPAPEQPKP